MIQQHLMNGVVGDTLSVLEFNDLFQVFSRLNFCSLLMLRLRSKLLLTAHVSSVKGIYENIIGSLFYILRLVIVCMFDEIDYIRIGSQMRDKCRIKTLSTI